MKCKFCGEELEEDSVFCSSCGRIIGDNADEVNDITESVTEAIGYDVTEDFATDIDDEAENDIFDKADSEKTCSPDESAGNDAELADFAESENPDQSETVVETLSDSRPATNDSASGNSKMTLAVVLLSAALLAIIGFLFIDKLMTLNASANRATTIRILSQSEDISIKAGTPTKFFVDAEGTNLTYQWYIKKSGDQMWHLWKNHDKSETSSKANESWDGMQVYCMITDNNRTALASDVITITIVKK